MSTTYTKSNLKGRKFRALRVVKGLSTEDIPALRANLKAQIEGIEGATMTETDSLFEFSNGQFVMKPKQPKELVGVVTFGPTYATFNNIRIEYKSITIGKYADFETDYAHYSFHAELQ